MMTIENERNDTTSPEQSLVEAMIRVASLPSLVHHIELQIQAAMERADHIEQWLETLASNNNKVHEANTTLAHRLEGLDENVGAVIGSLESLELVIQRQESRADQHFESHVLDPLTRRTFPLIDMIDDCLVRLQKPSDANATSKVLPTAMQTMETPESVTVSCLILRDHISCSLVSGCGCNFGQVPDQSCLSIVSRYLSHRNALLETKS